MRLVAFGVGIVMVFMASLVIGWWLHRRALARLIRQDEKRHRNYLATLRRNWLRSWLSSARVPRLTYRPDPEDNG